MRVDGTFWISNKLDTNDEIMGKADWAPCQPGKKQKETNKYTKQTKQMFGRLYDFVGMFQSCRMFILCNP